MDNIEHKRGFSAGLILAVVAIVLVVAAFAFGLVDINQTKETKLPEVAVKGGQAPAFDVDAAKVKVGSENTEVSVPSIDVSTEKVGVEVPTVDVEKAN